MPLDIGKLGSANPLRVIGLMSGTSADGVDAALVEIGRRRAKVLAFKTFPYPAAVRRKLFELFVLGEGRIDDLCHMNFVVGEMFAAAAIGLARRAGVPMGSIHLIGSHGQTVCHIPRPRRWYPGLRQSSRSSLQIGEPCVIAQRTGVTTVADFRARDVAAGGQGAPLVPFADWFLFRHARRKRSVQKVGGIANVTYLPAGGGVDSVLAFDTGPGNMVIDGVVSLATRGRLDYDVGGRLGARGRVSDPLLNELMRHPYFARRPPKTTGREEFGAQYAQRLHARAVARGLAAEDIVATATALTATSIAQAHRRFLKNMPDEVILCGGGARNRTLVGMLREQIHPVRVMLTDDLGVNADAKEAVSFAILACQTVRGLAGNVPAATGAPGGVVLGKIIPGRPPGK